MLWIFTILLIFIIFVLLMCIVLETWNDDVKISVTVICVVMTLLIPGFVDRSKREVASFMRNHKAVVIYTVKSTCPYCEFPAPFYARKDDQAGDKTIRLTCPRCDGYWYAKELPIKLPKAIPAKKPVAATPGK